MNSSTRQTVDTLIHANWVMPIRPKHQLLKDHSIAINKQQIIDILPTEHCKQRYQTSNEHTLNQHLLMPGLINTHGHAAMTLLRGMADDYPLEEWLHKHIWPAEAKWVDEHFVYDGSELAIAEMLRSGITSFSDMYFFPEATAKAASAAGIRAQLSFPIFDFPSAWGKDANDYISKGLKLRDDLGHHSHLTINFGPHAPYTVSDEPLKRIATIAAELDCGIQIHCHETEREIAESLEQYGQRPLARLDKLGLLSPNTQLVHMTQINQQDIQQLQNSGAHVIHCPSSNMKLASGSCPVEQLLSSGINVALGTDSAASNNSLNLFKEVHIAALLAKLSSNNAAALSDWQALELATINGAKALGIDNKAGSLEPQKDADIIAIDFSQIEQHPLYDPASQLVYTDCSSRVSHSWIAGELTLKDRIPTRLNLEKIQNNALHWRNKIRPSEKTT